MYLEYSRSKKYLNGLTLTELTIVLSVIGFILGAIWIASSFFHQNLLKQKAQAQVLTIIEEYRSLYSMRQVSGTDWTDITAMGMTLGLFPPDMIVAGQSNPVNPWGGQVYVYKVPSQQGIIIQYNYLTSSQCIAFASGFSGIPNMLWGQIDNEQRFFQGTGSTGPFSVSEITQACNELNEGDDYARFMFGASG